MIEKATHLLAWEKPVFLVSIDEDGRPDARAMSVVKAESCKTTWMVTGKNCDKYRQLAARPECMLYATDIGDGAGYLELRLWGRVEILDDAASRALAWRDEYLAHFPGGQNDPNMCVLKFTADSGVFQTLAGKEKLSL